MTSSHFARSFSLTLLASAMLQSGPTFPAELEPALEDAIAQAQPTTLIPILAVFNEQVSSEQLYALADGLSREERRRVVLNAKRVVTNVQVPVLSYLESQALLGNATTPISIFSVNAIATHAKPSVIDSLANLLSLDTVLLDRETITTANCSLPPDYSICDDTMFPCPSAGPNECDHVVVTCRNNENQEVTIPVPLSMNPSDPSVSYAVQFLGLETVWEDFMLKGTGSLILDVDTGIDYCQPSIKDRYSFNTCEDPIPDGVDDDHNGFDDDYFGWDRVQSGDRDPYSIPDDPDSCRFDDHGTYSAGCAVGDGSIYPGFGGKITGTAPGASLRSFRGIFQSQTLLSVQYALAIGADVFTVQALTPGQSEFVRSGVRTLDAAGITTLASMGNSLSQPVLDVPSVPEAIGVGGVWNLDLNPARCDTSRYRHPSWSVVWLDGTVTKPDLVAPAEPVETVAGYWDCHRQRCEGEAGNPQGEYAHQFHGGTSLSAPLVAGMVAIMYERNNEILPSEIREVLERTAMDVGVRGRDIDFGAGVPQISAALREIPLFNTFDRYLRQHAMQVGGLPTNWQFKITGDPPPVFSIVDLTPGGYDPCDTLSATPQGVLQIEPQNGHYTRGYVWDDHPSYRMDFDFEIKSYPAGGSHETPFFGALLRFDPDNDHSLYIRSSRPSGQPTQIVLARRQAGDQNDVVLAQTTIPWHWNTNTAYSWHIWDDGSTVSLTADRPGSPGTVILNHVPYSCTVSEGYKGLFVYDGTLTQFDNVSIQGFQAVLPGILSQVISRYGAAQGVTVGVCPENNDPVKHPSGIGPPAGHAADYWIEAYVSDVNGKRMPGYWDVKLDFSACIDPDHPGMPPSKQVYADGPTDASGRTVFRQVLRIGGSDSCAYSVKAGGQILENFNGETTRGLRSPDIEGNGVVGLEDIGAWQTAFINGGVPLWVSDLNVDGEYALNDLGVLQRHFIEHVPTGGRQPLTKGDVPRNEREGQDGDVSLYLSLMDRLPDDVPMPAVLPGNAVTSIDHVPEGGRDVTVGLYAARYTELAGVHVRLRWPEGWQLLAVGDSIVAGQIFGTPDRYWTAGASYITAFNCLSGGGPSAVGRFDLRVLRPGQLRFEEDNAMVRILNCGLEMHDLVPPGGQELKADKSTGSALSIPEIQFMRSSPTVSKNGAEFTLTLGRETWVSATVYDVTGRVVKILADQAMMATGVHKIRWDGMTVRGGRAGSGVYIFKVIAADKRFVEQVVIVR